MKKVLLVLLLMLTTICHSQTMTKSDLVVDAQMSTFMIYTNWVKEMGDTAWRFTRYDVMMKNRKYQNITEYIHLSYNTKEELLKDFRFVRMDILPNEKIHIDKFTISRLSKKANRLSFALNNCGTECVRYGEHYLYKSVIDLIEKSLVDNPKPIDLKEKKKERKKANKTASKFLLGFVAFIVIIMV